MMSSMGFVDLVPQSVEELDLAHKSPMTKLYQRVLLLILLSLCVAPPVSARGGRIIDDNDRVTLHGNVHPKARAEFDAGATDATLRMDRMVLTLRPSAPQQTALRQLVADQQDPASPDYHRWLTPEVFGLRFGPTPEDIATVTDWLTSRGFSIDEVAKGRTWVNFSGTVAAVDRAFRTRMHNYQVNGALYSANSQDPSIPRGLSDLVAGVSTLHNFPRRPMHGKVRPLESSIDPAYNAGGKHSLAPGDFAAIYNLNPLYNKGTNGAGQSIAIVGRTHPAASNWSSFRSSFGLSSNPPLVVVNGTDPGDLGASEDGEADLDVEWSGAVAKNATVTFVVSKSTRSTDGVDLSAQYIVSNNLAPVMSVSFGQCESEMSATENTFYSNLWAQAAAQGISVFVSSGDEGASGCDSGSSSSGTVLGVNGLASTPYNVAVGGTEFNEGAGSYWNSSNDSSGVSAFGYIPETTWNESGSASTGYCPSDSAPCAGLWSSGGGVSALYAKPSWQTGSGVPADGMRDLPDVSLTSAIHDGYRVMTQGSWFRFSGTSASSPSFAGLMALIVQQTGQRQGNANQRLYQLAAAQGAGGPAVYHDITTGDNSVPGLTGYSAGAGYDLSTGLGSVDATQLVNNFASNAVNGACGSSNGGVFNVPPAANLCASGTAGPVSGSGPWSWSCAGLNGGTSAGCTASIQSFSVTFAAGANGTLSGNTLQTVNYGSSAATVTALPAPGYFFVNWTEGGSVVSSVAALVVSNVSASHSFSANFAPSPVNGACGSGNGAFFNLAPAANLCALGTAGPVSGSGPWSWSCSGSFGGAPATCSALSDTGAPALTVSTLADQSTTNNPILNVAGSASDSVSGVRGVTVNGQQASIAGDGSFSAVLTLVDGANTITVVATDNAGNATSSQRTVNLDRTAPVLTLSQPADNSATALELAEINGTVDDPNAVIMARVNNGIPTATTMDGSAFSVSFGLVPGLNTVDITATDLAGNSSDLKRSITYDPGKPALSVDKPAQDIGTIQKNLPLSGSVSDSYSSVAVSIAVNGQTYTPVVASDGSFSQIIDLPLNATYAVVVTANNQAGGTASVQRNIVKMTPGDLNGDGVVDISDALLALRIAVGIVSLSPSADEFVRGDVAPLTGGVPTPDGAITVADALLILKRAVGLVTW